MILPGHYLLVSAVVFTIGVLVVIARRDPMIVLLGIELMLEAAGLACVALASWFEDWGGEIATLVVIAMAAVQLATGIGAAVAVGHPQEDTERLT